MEESLRPHFHNLTFENLERPGDERVVLEIVFIERNGNGLFLRRRRGRLGGAGGSGNGFGRRYRNGRGEFGGNGLEMEEMMLRTNPEVVGVAMDAADVKRAGADMVNFFARHQNRMDCVFIREWETVAYGPLAAEMAARRWDGWLVQSPADAVSRRAITRLFSV